MKLSYFDQNALKSVEYLLTAKKIKVSKTGLNTDLGMHPDFPSLSSISDAFVGWNVPNMAVRIGIEHFRKVQFPAIVYLNENGGIYAAVKSVSDEKVEWLHSHRGWQRESLSSFATKWDGVMLLVDPKPNSGEVSYEKSRRKENLGLLRRWMMILIPVLMAALSIGIGGAVIDHSSFYLYAVKISGLAATSILLWQSLDPENPFIQNICHLSSRTNCNDILNSKASKITTWLSWSDIGFVYFGGGLSTLFLSSLIGVTDIHFLLAILNFAALPYTVYSIYYQYFVAKRWCPICVFVQILVWSEFVLFVVFYGVNELYFDLKNLEILLFGFLIPAFLLILLKKPIADAEILSGVQRELHRIKFSDTYVKAFFSDQTTMPPIFEGMRTARVGDPSAETVITVVTNPLCGPCSTLHAKIDRAVKESTHVSFQFVFFGPPGILPIVDRFISSKPEDVGEIMASWYNNISQDLPSWIKDTGDYFDFEDTRAQLQLHARWSELANVKGTPTMFFNGILIPSAFSISDAIRLGRIWHDNQVSLYS